MKKGIIIAAVAASILALAGCKMGGNGDDNGNGNGATTNGNGMQTTTQTTTAQPAPAQMQPVSAPAKTVVTTPAKKATNNNQYQQ